MSRELSPETFCNHPPFGPLPYDNHPLVPPIYQNVKFKVDDFSELKRIFHGEREGYFYSRASNPTCAVLEKTLAHLQGTAAARVTATGNAAITSTLLALLQHGDRLLYFYESYSPTRMFAETMLQKFGVILIRMSIDDHEGIRSVLNAGNTKAVLFESISNPQLKAAPLALIFEEAKKNGVLTILDNTFAGFQSWKDWAFDICIHSLTKYASGHGDVMGGAIMGSDYWISQIDRSLHLTGATLDPHAAFLIQRGLKTYHVRRRAQCVNAKLLAEWLSKHPAVESVIYPGLPSHPHHEWFKSQFNDFGTMIYLTLKDKSINAENLVTRGRIFELAGSLGSTDSLITPALFFFGRDLTDEERAVARIDGTAMRLSIGLENPNDLAWDLGQILA